jgi:hypothetical protein
MATRSPRWHGSEEAKEANSEDSGKAGRQPVSTSSKRHGDVLEKFARNAVKLTYREGGGKHDSLEAGEDAHNAMEKKVK